MQREEIQNLVNKYLNDTATAAELEQLSAWYRSASEENLEWFADVKDEERLLKAAMYSRIEQELGIEKKKTKKLWPRIGIAAAVAAIAVGIWFFTAPNTSRHPEGSAATRDLYANDIAPGKNTAVLIVNGKQTQLSDAKLGIVVNDDIKYNDGTALVSSALDINNPSSRANAKDHGLEVITPKGGTYFVILQDGTKVWLNADSKLEVIPNFWNKTQRLVRLTGEAYFEVAKNASRPFRVESQGQQVTVLGTHFNVSAYKGEGIKTTLLEGSVSVRHAGITTPSLRGGTTKQPHDEIAASRNAPRNDGDGVTLKPNQQSVVTENEKITVKNVDPTEAIDWKNGEFIFKGEALENIMRKVARWYNIEVTYEANAPKEFTLSGVVSRTRNISAVLERMESTGKVKFKIEGRKVIVGR